MNTDDQERQQAREAIVELGQLEVDVLGLRTWLENKTRMGRKAHPSDPYGYTKQYLAEYSEHTDPAEVIRLLQSQSINNDIGVGRYLLQHDDLLPEWE